jgi:hypothetical protein
VRCSIKSISRRSVFTTEIVLATITIKHTRDTDIRTDAPSQQSSRSLDDARRAVCSAAGQDDCAFHRWSTTSSELGRFGRTAKTRSRGASETLRWAPVENQNVQSPNASVRIGSSAVFRSSPRQMRDRAHVGMCLRCDSWPNTRFRISHHHHNTERRAGSA